MLDVLFYVFLMAGVHSLWFITGAAVLMMTESSEFSCIILSAQSEEPASPQCFPILRHRPAFSQWDIVILTINPLRLHVSHRPFFSLIVLLFLLNRRSLRLSCSAPTPKDCGRPTGEKKLLFIWEWKMLHFPPSAPDFSSQLGPLSSELDYLEGQFLHLSLKLLLYWTIKGSSDWYAVWTWLDPAVV